MEPLFDIFSGTPTKGPVWVCAVRGLENAKKRMKEMAAVRPGSYFIFFIKKKSVVSSVHTVQKSA